MLVSTADTAGNLEAPADHYRPAGCTGSLDYCSHFQPLLKKSSCAKRVCLEFTSAVGIGAIAAEIGVLGGRLKDTYDSRTKHRYKQMNKGGKMALTILVPRSTHRSNGVDKVKGWVRSIFELNESTTVTVSEVLCAEPDYAPLKTVIVFLGPGGSKFEQKLHKALREVTVEDVQSLKEEKRHGND
jgi:hypothetical protein